MNHLSQGVGTQEHAETLKMTRENLKSASMSHWSRYHVIDETQTIFARKMSQPCVKDHKRQPVAHGAYLHILPVPLSRMIQSITKIRPSTSVPTIKVSK